MIVGRKVIWLAETTSTMEEIDRLADRGEAEGVTIVADFQSRGKGRAGREWVAPPGSALLVSILLRPKISASLISALPLHLGVSVAEAIEEVTGKAAELKWPNDVLMNDKKVAGVLVTSRLNGQRIDHVTVGIGINIASNARGLPATATTLSRESGKPIDRQQLLDVLLSRLDGTYESYVEAHGELDLERWTSRAAYLNERVLIIDSGEQLEGTVSGIDISGALILELGDGTIRKVVSGEFTRGPRRTDDKP